MRIRYVMAMCVLGLWQVDAHAALLPANSYYVESGGVIVGEAEDFHSRTNAGIEVWRISNEILGTDGATPVINPRGLYMQSLPDDNGGGAAPNTGAFDPSLTYRMNITTTGTYRLFLRWDGDPNYGNSDSVFTDIVELKDGTSGTNAIADWYVMGLNTGYGDSDFSTLPAWDGSGIKESTTAGTTETSLAWTISTPGIYTLRFSQREDGSALDAWAFQLSSLAGPTGTGPAVSLVAIPEPSSFALLVPILGAVYFARRRQQAC